MHDHADPDATNLVLCRCRRINVRIDATTTQRAPRRKKKPGMTIAASEPRGLMKTCDWVAESSVRSAARNPETMSTMVAVFILLAERSRSATRRTIPIRKTDDCPRCAVATGWAPSSRAYRERPRPTLLVGRQNKLETAELVSGPLLERDFHFFCD
jgi:hypothetical protein